MSRPWTTHLGSSSTPGTTGGGMHSGTTNYTGSYGTSRSLDRSTAPPVASPHTPNGLAIQTTALDNSNLTALSINETGLGKDVDVSRIPTEMPRSWQRANIGRGTSRHKASSSLHHHRDVIEGKGCGPASSSQPPSTQHPALRLDIQKTRSASTSSIAAPRQSNGMTRTHAMRELLSSERTYARDLALVCDVHIPLAQGKLIQCAEDIPSPPPLSAKSRSGSSQLRFTASSSSTNPSHSGPPMTDDDVNIVFRNISDIANFSSQFVKRLETALSHALDGSSDEDKVGDLFLEIIPNLEPLYKRYLRTHSAALIRLQRLSSSLAFWNYRSSIRSLLPEETHFQDLPFVLLKPKKRVLEYCHLLCSIIDTTPFSHRGRVALVQAHDKMERVARDINSDINNGRKVERGVLSIKTTLIANGTTGHGNTEATELAQLENRLQAYPIFLDRLGKDVKDLEIATRHSVESLRQWGITFGAVLGLAPSPSAVYPPAYEVFTSLLSSLPEICETLEDDVQKTFNPLLRKLKEMTERPKQLISEMHSLESARTPSSPFQRLWRPNPSKNHQHHLRSTLVSQLPVLLDAMDRAVGLAVRIVTQRLVAFLEAVKEKWINLFNSLKEEVERYGGTEETLRAWKVRWEVGRQKLLMWENKYVFGESAVREMSSATRRSEISLPVQLQLVNGAPPKLRLSVSYPPGPPSSRRIRQSVTDVAPVPYTIRVHRSYSPPPHDPYRGHPFFSLITYDSFEVLQEYGHPLTHTDLPRFCLGKKGDLDCLLKVRARDKGVGHEAGDVGWVLARFVDPAD